MSSSVVISFLVSNKTVNEIKLVVEPWAEYYIISPGRTADIRVESNEIGTLEFEQLPDRLIVYGYTGCVIRVFCEGEEMEPFFE